MLIVFLLSDLLSCLFAKGKQFDLKRACAPGNPSNLVIVKHALYYTAVYFVDDIAKRYTM